MSRDQQRKPGGTVAKFNAKPRCHYCRARGVALTKDHIVPLARAGQDRTWNIVLACVPCNTDKGSDWPTCSCNLCHASIERHRRIGVTREHPGLVKVAAGRSSYRPRHTLTETEH